MSIVQVLTTSKEISVTSDVRDPWNVRCSIETSRCGRIRRIKWDSYFDALEKKTKQRQLMIVPSAVKDEG